MTRSHSDPSCVFCKIVAGQVPCWKLHESAAALAFLDIGPLSEGHCLVIPRKHYETIDQMPPGEVAECASVLPALSRAVREATGVDGWNVLQNNGRVSGQAVGHVHFHIIPRREGDGLGYRWPAGSLGKEAAQRLQAEIVSRLAGSTG